MPPPSPWDDEFFGESDKQEYSAFFDEEGGPATASSDAGAAPRANAALTTVVEPTPIVGRLPSTGIESEYALLATLGREGGQKALAGETQGVPESIDGGSPPGGGSVCTSSAMTFSMDNDDEEDQSMHVAHEGYDVQDFRPPEMPEVPTDFTTEDLRLRDVLADFYLRHRADNVSNINVIVKRYRARSVSHLWAQLATKYKVSTHDTVELMGASLYTSAPFEYDEVEAQMLERRLCGGQAEGPAAGSLTAEERARLLRESLENPQSDDLEAILRYVCFRGLHQGSNDLRPLVWKILLGVLPAQRPAAWRDMEGEMRSMYARYKSEVLVVSNDFKFEVKVEPRRLMGWMQLLHQIQKDVERTRQDFDYFRKPSTRAALISMLFVYAHLHPDVEYVQGMNELAAVMLYIASGEQEFEEADAFWCFTFLMRELEANFVKALGSSGDKMPAELVTLERLLRTYDIELAKHLHKVNCPISTFAFRWCNLLFAQDLPLTDVVRLWDCFIADPRRFDVVGHLCFALMLSGREQLLSVQDPGTMHDLLSRLPRRAEFESWLRLAWAVCAFERRAQAPAFPQLNAEQVVSELSGWAQTAAARAQEFGVGFAKTVRQNMAPAVKDRVVQASNSKAAQGAMVVARGSVGAMKAWLEQDAPIQPENVAKVTSLWEIVRSSGAVAVSETQRLASEYVQAEKAEVAAARLSGAVDVAASTSAALSSAVVSRLQTAMSRKSDGNADTVVRENVEATGACDASERTVAAGAA